MTPVPPDTKSPRGAKFLDEQAAKQATATYSAA